MIVSGKRHGATDSFVAGAITGGVTVFLMTGPMSSSEDSFVKIRAVAWTSSSESVVQYQLVLKSYRT
jgi:hypothetical protein